MVLHNLPQQLMPFVGREADINEISTLLDDANCRLLSLIGAGGMGKTRLSLEVAHRKLDEFADGVYFVPLQPLSSAEGIKMTIALAIGFQFGGEKEALDQLLDYLSDKNMLLVLDNFEHLLDGADIVSRILEVAPRVKIVVTSREALKLQLEWTRIIMGMSFPTNGQHDGLVDTYSAIQLFVERARRIQLNFSLDDNLSCVIRICQLVGGMPLGIELAVAWLKTLSCGEIGDEIQRNTDILTAQMRDFPERHQSIRVVFNSSWEMLTADEQSAFMRLSVFRGTPTRQAIQAVTGASLPTLSGLADKALIFPYENGRYQIHELLRQYAYEKLEGSDEHQATHNAHSQYYLRFLQEREHDIQGRRQVEALDEIMSDFENVRVAWLWGLERKDYEGIGGAVETLCMYLHLRSHWKHDSYLIAQAQEQLAPQAGETPHPVWGKILARNHDNVEAAIEQLELALTIAQAQDDADDAEIGLCWQLMGYTFSKHYEQEEAIRCHEASIPFLEAAGDHYHLAAAYGSLAEAYRLLGEYEVASSFNRLSLDLRRELGDLDGQAFAIAEISHEMFMAGNFVQAERYRREALGLAQQIGRIWSISGQVWELALFHLFGVQGDLGTASELIKDTLKYSDAWYGGFSGDIALTASLFAGVRENYGEAREKGEQALETAVGDAWRPMFGWGLLVAACGQGDYLTVRQHTYDLLYHFNALQVRPFMMVGVAFSAIVAAYHDQQPRRATELLALAMTHPYSMTGWLKMWPLIERLQAHLEAELGAVAYQAAWERGQGLDVDNTVQGLINVLGDEVPSAHISEMGIPTYVLEANAALLEPLSERELEVLFKIAEGCSNREIATQLFIGLSTVKKHITHIYGKLGVDSRTQALLKAQEIGLI